MAGFDKQSSGSLLYEGNAYEKSWLGKVKQKKSVFSSIDPKHNGNTKTISNYVSAQFPKKKKMIENVSRHKVIDDLRSQHRHIGMKISSTGFSKHIWGCLPKIGRSL